MSLSVRMVRPVETQFKEMPFDELADAACEFLGQHRDRSLFVLPEDFGCGREVVHFAVVEVEGCGEFAARYFYSGIGRRGGVKMANPRQCRSLSEVERRLSLPGGSLEATDWVGEETSEDAASRKASVGVA